MSNDVWNLDEYDSNQEDLNASGSVLPGFYVAQIFNHKLEEKDKGDCHNFAWEIIETGTDKTAMKGRKIYDYLYDYESCAQMFRRQGLALAVATGYWNRETLNSAKKQGLTMPAPDFAAFNGLSCVIKVEDEEYEGKKRAKIRGFYPIDSKEAKEAGLTAAPAGSDMFG